MGGNFEVLQLELFFPHADETPVHDVEGAGGHDGDPESITKQFTTLPDNSCVLSGMNSEKIQVIFSGSTGKFWSSLGQDFRIINIINLQIRVPEPFV